MRDFNEDIRFLCTKGFCKLFYSDIIEYSSILGTLILELFHPLSAKFKNDHACLRAFFPMFAVSPKHQRTLEEALLDVITLLLNESDGSSLSKIKLTDILGFYLPLLLPNAAQQQQHQDFKYDPNIHKRLAKKFLSMIVSNPLGKPTRELPPILLKLNIQPNPAILPKTPKKGEESDRPGQGLEDSPNGKTARDLIYDCRVLLEKALGFVTDKTARSNLEKFKQKLEAIDNSPLKEVNFVVSFLTHTQGRHEHTCTEKACSNEDIVRSVGREEAIF